MMAAPVPRSNSPVARMDLRSLRWAITVCALLTAANVFRSYEPALWVAAVANTAFGVLLCFYFGHILLRRLQCSLLEFMVIGAVLFNVEGLLLTSPGFMAFGWLWASWLGLVAAAWVLAGAVNGLAASQILSVTGSAPRLGLLAAHWAGAAAPALLLTGGALCLAKPHGLFEDSYAVRALVAPRMTEWGLPLLIVGATGLFLRFWLGIKVRRLARAKLKYVSSGRQQQTVFQQAQ